jgi:stearoyl-CoA desaturase (delta-9 desaturase)
MGIILTFFFLHWYLSLFSQTFFLHRYAAHKLFFLNPFWEKFFYIFTYVMQGSSFLSPKGYAILHRQHHAYSDTEKDPHSPHNHPNLFKMMWETKKTYSGYAKGYVIAEDRFSRNVPFWPIIDKIGGNWISRILWAGFYIGFYITFVPAGMWYLYFLLPIHFLMGPVHGAIVNWCGHMYGYQNFDNNDKSRNSLIFDFVMGGELFQNNHHKHGTRLNFAAKWFEFDPTYPVIKLLLFMKVIRVNPNPVD